MPQLDDVPLWGLFGLTVAIVLASVEFGFRVGGYVQRTHSEKEGPVGGIVGATLGLLAFVLAFTFGLAATRFDARRQMVVKEANAIGTAFLRAGTLPAPHDKDARKLLMDYADARMLAFEHGTIEEALAESDRLHHALWAEAQTIGKEEPRSVVGGLFIQATNDVIDIHAERVLISVRNRIPLAVWGGLYFVTILSMGAVGYHEGITGSRRSLVIFALALTFSAVMLLIADLDRPREGLLQVSQQAMIETRDFMKATVNASTGVSEATPKN